MSGGRLEVLDFYQEVVSEDFLSSLLECSGRHFRDGIFGTAVVIWLMIFQRLNPDKTLASAVEELRHGDSHRLLSLSQGSIQARTGRVSGSTGAYASARQRVPVEMVDAVSDRLNEAIRATHAEQLLEGRRVYLLDGSTIRLAYSADNIEEYPQYKNQHGESHYPLARIVAATDAVTGVCDRPAFGPHNGSKAVSEIPLAEEVLERLPSGSLVIGDRYFGCFRIAYSAHQRGKQVICRMQESKAKKFIGSPKSVCGEKEYIWEPSTKERKKYPDLPSEAAVKGRFIWYTLQRAGFRPIFLILFTTTELPLEKIVELYGLRWNIEVDFRDIKATLKMQSLTAKSPGMVHKEIVLGFTAYNLLRHVMGVAAMALGVDPRTLSFSRFLKRVNALGGIFISDRADQEVFTVLSRALSDLKSLQLPKRKKERILEPRKKWPGGEQRIMSGSREQERARALLERGALK